MSLSSQVLISDARSVDNRSGAKGSKKGNEKGKLNKKKTSSLHDNKGPIESIEMDSRLLSALLTVSNFYYLKHQCFKKC